jgi:mitochondrial fission protein ELM1
MSGGRVFRIQIQDPGISPTHFDVVVVPRHDRLRGDNVVVTRGALHRITPTALATARERFRHLSLLPRPRIAVLVGGSNGAYRLDPPTTERLADQLVSMATATQAALMTTTSRRTGADNEAILRRKMAEVPGELWDGHGDNPYCAYLAFADAVVVTCDSINMVCEACYTGKPVYVAALPGGSAKFRHFHEGMAEDGFTRRFEGRLEEWSSAGLDDTGEAAAAIRRYLAEKVASSR